MNTISFQELAEVNPRVNLQKGKTYPFVEMGVVQPGLRYVDSNQNRSFKGGGAKFMSGDTLFARITPCLENGKIAQYISKHNKTGFGSTEFFVFRARPGLSDPGFVYYLSRSDIIRKPAEKSMTGASGRQRADLASIVNLPILHFPLPTQRKIAAILSAYDDLIENNLRRINILEEMAQNLYREWFVKFRFPGHEQVRFVDSEMGRIPEGWEVVTVNDICDFVSRGVTPKYEAGTQRFIINQKANTGSEICFPYLKELQSDFLVPSEKFARTGDLLINCLGEGTIGRVHLFLSPNNEWAVDQHMSICRSSNIAYTTYLYFFMDSFEGQAKIQSLKSGGTNMTTFNMSTLKAFSLIMPKEKLLNDFYMLIWKLFNQKRNLQTKNVKLRHTRDLLLPRLISGEVDVSGLDISLPNENGL